jgi:flagellar biosynthesis protein FlhG
MVSDIMPISQVPQEFSPIAVNPLSKVFAVTSGKGGVGKTFFSANLAASMSKLGLRVLVVDFDLGLANLDVVLNLNPKFTLHDVFAGKAKIDEAIIDAPGGFDVLLAGSSRVEYARLAPGLRENFLHTMRLLAPAYDIVLMDTGAGLSEVVLFAVSIASEVLVLVTPEPTSLTDAYATIKVLAKQQRRKKIRIVVNQTARQGDGRTVTTQLQQVLDRYVKPELSQVVKLIYTGEIPADPCVRQAVMRRQLLMKTMPGCPAALAIQQIAVQIEHTLIKP